MCSHICKSSAGHKFLDQGISWLEVHIVPSLYFGMQHVLWKAQSHVSQCCHQEQLSVDWAAKDSSHDVAQPSSDLLRWKLSQKMLPVDSRISMPPLSIVKLDTCAIWCIDHRQKSVVRRNLCLTTAFFQARSSRLMLTHGVPENPRWGTSVKHRCF